ncbi:MULTISPECIES: hypothetical protein [Thermococcus]|nr:MULTISPECIES: hypothetical protein [Thermococcus]AEK74031.1 hypothetical protein GQS_10690 [Thermococcus sp. 4557]
MAKFDGYELILETPEELQNFVKALEKAKERDPREVEDTVKRALAIVGII